MYAPTMPRIAPSTASAPAVTALMLRRVDDVASRGGEGPHLPRRLAADEADGHREDHECEQHARGDRSPAQVGEPRLVVVALDLDAVLRRDDRAALSWLADSGVDVSISH